LSGIGDIFLTCSSVSSRNYAFGLLIGKGKSKGDILKKNNTVTEGLENARSLYLIKKKYNLDTPILDSIYKILVKNYSVKKIVNLLLARPLKKE
jgi:glycerol-3-phosphate dehydrogenase (NAD(P)+)